MALSWNSHEWLTGALFIPESNSVIISFKEVGDLLPLQNKVHARIPITKFDH